VGLNTVSPLSPHGPCPPRRGIVDDRSFVHYSQLRQSILAFVIFSRVRVLVRVVFLDALARLPRRPLAMSRLSLSLVAGYSISAYHRSIGLFWNSSVEIH
jgi:hypothetical protein